MFRRKVADNIEFRQFAAEDAVAVFAVVERNREYLRQWLPWVDLTHSAADVGNFIAEAAEQYAAGLGPNAGIWLDGALVGSIGVHSVEPHSRSCCAGYWIESGHQGKGIITRCCVELLDYLFEEMRMHRVVIRCAPGNLRSAAVPRRLGFTLEGIAREAQWLNGHWEDLEVWSMLEEDWLKTR